MLLPIDMSIAVFLGPSTHGTVSLLLSSNTTSIENGSLQSHIF